MNTNSKDWTDCPPGEIGGLVSRLKSARRRKTLQQAAAVTTVVLAFALAATILVSGWFTGNSEIPYIACEKVHELAPLYVKGQTEVDISAQIDKHLKGCEQCRGHFRQAYPKFPLPQQSAHSTECAPLTVASVAHLP